MNWTAEFGKPAASSSSPLMRLLSVVSVRHPDTKQHAFMRKYQNFHRNCFFSINLCSELNNCVDYNHKGDSKGKVHPRTGHEGPEGE
jgi:hypothetical protein